MLAENHTNDHILRLIMYIDELSSTAANTPGVGIGELAEILFEYH